MGPVVQSVVVWAVTGGLGVAAGWVASWWRGSRRRDRALEEGVRELLLCELERLHARMVDDGGIADESLKARAQRIYDAYSGMGGNGHGTQVNTDIQHAPIRPKRNPD